MVGNESSFYKLITNLIYLEPDVCFRSTFNRPTCRRESACLRSRACTGQLRYIGRGTDNWEDARGGSV